MNTTRRDFCKTALAAVAGATLAPSLSLAADGRKPKIALIVVTYGMRTHGDNIGTRLLEGYWINNQYHPPFGQVVSAYIHHPPKDNRGDLSQRLSESYGFKICPTIAEALTLGTGKLAVDAVAIVSEDGNTYWSKNPFFLFFSQVVEVFQKSGRSVPVFNDKALSHDWHQARWMVQQSHDLKFPLLAGSTLAVTFRRPELEFSTDTVIEEAVSACGFQPPHIESGAFHGMELLQAMVERRRGGETGIKSVRFLEGKAVWEAAEKGLWSRPLLDAALVRGNATWKGTLEEAVKHPYALLIQYNDGLRGTLFNSAGTGTGYTFAARLAGGKVESTQSYYVGLNGNSFSCLVDLFARMMKSGKPAFPPERTMLTCGAIDFLMRSRMEGNRELETPELAAVKYPPGESPSYFRGAGL